MNGPDDLDRRLKELGETPPEAVAPGADPEGEARAIERLITRRIRRICLKTLLCVALCAALVFFGIHPLLKFTSLDPIKMEEDDMGFTRYLNAYYGTMQPYVQVTGTVITDTGFSTYEAALGVTGAGEYKVVVGDNTDVRLTIKQGEVSTVSDPGRLLTKDMNRFDCGWNTREDILADLRKLPESCYIRLSVGTDTPLPLSELGELPIKVVWAQVYDPDGDFQGGIFLSPSLRFGGLEYPDGTDDAQMARYYSDQLELLLTQPELLKSLGIYSGSTVFYTLSPVEEALSFARKQSVLTSKNYCVAGSRDEIAAFLSSTETTSLLVDHIFLSRLSD